jgi:hypothetical protein
VHGYVYPAFGRIKGAEPTGIAHVFVNGRPVWSEGKHPGERAGRALRRQQMQAEAR